MKLRALTCHLGCMPNDKQIASICPQKIYQSIVKVLASEGQSIGKVLAKDIEDATGVQEVKDYWKIKKRQQREKLHNVQETVKDMSSHKSRLDKTILDKIRKEDTTNTDSSGFNFYIKNINPIMTPYEADVVKSLIDDYSEEWFIEACKAAVTNNVRKVKYIEAVLKKSKESGGINKGTREQAEAERRRLGRIQADKREKELLEEANK